LCSSQQFSRHGTLYASIQSQHQRDSIRTPGKGPCIIGHDQQQLENLKRRLEEDFRLDLAAVDRLLQRFSVAPPSAAPAVDLPAYSGLAAKMPDSQYPRIEPIAPPDDLTHSIRAMFSHAG